MPRRRTGKQTIVGVDLANGPESTGVALVEFGSEGSRIVGSRTFRSGTLDAQTVADEMCAEYTRGPLADARRKVKTLLREHVRSEPMVGIARLVLLDVFRRRAAELFAKGTER